MGRPKLLSDDQKNVAFRCDRKLYDELNSLATDLSLTPSDLLRLSLPLFLKVLSRLVRK